MSFNHFPSRLLLFVIFGTTASSCSAPVPEPSIEEVFSNINQEVLQNGRAYLNLNKATATIGHRLTGSENGKQAEELAASLLRSYGMEKVEFFEFEVDAWMRESISLTIPGDSGDYDVDVVSLAHSPLDIEMEDTVIFAGSGLKEDFERLGIAVAGQIVLMNLGLEASDKGKPNLHRSEKTALAVSHGATGVILINHVDGHVLLTGTASVTGELLAIPAMCVTNEEGAVLRKKLEEEQVVVKVEMKNQSKPIKARNVIGTIPGRELAQEKIVIGGHLDSWDLATGAIDNGVGSFTIIDIARTFKALSLNGKRTIQFILFMGEEQGLLGSTALVEHWVAANEIQNVRCMINLDMSSNAVGFNAFGREEMQPVLDSVGALIQQVDSTYLNTNTNGVGLHSDHQPFLLEGVPILSMKSNMPGSVYRCYHSSCDDFDLVEKEHLVNGTRFTAMLLYALANMESIPAKQFDSGQTRQFLEDAGLKEKLVLGKDWKW